MRSAVGQEVEIGVTENAKDSTVMAIRTPREGVVKVSRLIMLSMLVFVLLRLVIVLVVVAFLGLLASMIVGVILGSIVGNRTAVLIVCLIGVAALLVRVVWQNVRGIARTWSAWAAV